MGKEIFALDQVSFSYLGKYPALRDVHFTVTSGERLAIIGANGSGKSTLLHLLAGLIFADRGTIMAFGNPLCEEAFLEERFNRSFRCRVGLVFQNPDIQLFCPTVREEIAFGPLAFGVPPAHLEPAMRAIMHRFDIARLADRMPHQLSVGEKRKVAMAAVLISGPDVLLLDEPTAGLDPRTSRELMDVLDEYHGAGKTIITATHDMHIVEEIADTVYVFGRDKAVVRHGPPAEILSDIPFLQGHNLMHMHTHRHGGQSHRHPHQHLHEHHEHR